MVKRKRKLSPMYWARRTVQAFLVGLVVYLGWNHQYGSGEPIDSYCPFGAVESLWTTITTGGQFIPLVYPSNFILMGILVMMTLIAGGIFCGWICPLGTIQDWIYALRKKLIKRPVIIPHTVDRYLRLLKYLVLFLILYKSATLVKMWFAEFDPYKQLLHFKIESSIAYLVIGLFIVTSLLIERFWCRYLCPLGAIVAPLSKLGLLKVRKSDGCTSCNLCMKNCGMGLQEIGQLGCNNCMDCITDCPSASKAIEVRFGPRKIGYSHKLVPAAGLVVAVVLLIGTMGLGAWSTTTTSERVALPPGATTLNGYPAVETVILGSSYIDEIATIYDLTPEQIYTRAGLDPDQDGHKTVKEVTEAIGIKGEVIRDAVTELVQEK